jgi:hypothetical protein
LSWNLGGIAVREVPDDDIILREGVTGRFGLESHRAAPRVELACDGLEAGGGEGIDRDLSEELTRSGRRGNGDGEKSLSVSEMNL